MEGKYVLQFIVPLITFSPFSHVFLYNFREDQAPRFPPFAHLVLGFVLVRNSKLLIPIKSPIIHLKSSNNGYQLLS